MVSCVFFRYFDSDTSGLSFLTMEADVGTPPRHIARNEKGNEEGDPDKKSFVHGMVPDSDAEVLLELVRSEN